MIVVCGGIKGGSGKTTIATHLAAMRSVASDVLLVDADDQQTASDFTLWRNERLNGGAGYSLVQLAGAAVRYELLNLNDRYGDIIVDTGGRDTTSQRAALTIADTLLVPFLPRSFDVWTLERVARLIDEVIIVNPSLQTKAFLNRADPVGSDNASAAAELQASPAIEYIGTPIGNRKAISHASAHGLSVVEHESKSKAVAEFLALYRCVFGLPTEAEKEATDGAQ